MPSREDGRQLAIDVHDIRGTWQGDKAINAFLAAAGVLYRTARGRMAIQIKPDRFERIRKQLRLETADGLDGTRRLIFPPPKEKKDSQLPVDAEPREATS